MHYAQCQVLPYVLQAGRTPISPALSPKSRGAINYYLSHNYSQIWPQSELSSNFRCPSSASWSCLRMRYKSFLSGKWVSSTQRVSSVGRPRHTATNDLVHPFCLWNSGHRRHQCPATPVQWECRTVFSNDTIRSISSRFVQSIDLSGMSSRKRQRALNGVL